MNEETFASFLITKMNSSYSQRTLAEKARVSFRAIADARTGRMEKELERKDKLSARKLRGLASSTYRMLVALGEDPKEWMEKLGLVIPKHEVAKQAGFGARIQLLLPKPLLPEEIEMLGRTQKELGPLLTMEMALRILIQKHNL